MCLRYLYSQASVEKKTYIYNNKISNIENQKELYIKFIIIKIY